MSKQLLNEVFKEETSEQLLSEVSGGLTKNNVNKYGGHVKFIKLYHVEMVQVHVMFIKNIVSKIGSIIKEQ